MKKIKLEASNLEIGYSITPVSFAGKDYQRITVYCKEQNYYFDVSEDKAMLPNVFHSHPKEGFLQQTEAINLAILKEEGLL